MILDLEMPGMDGFEVLRAMNKQGSEVPVIVYTGTGDYDRCIQAIQLGAYGFIDKAEPMERVVREVETVLERKQLRSEVASLQRQLGETSLIGDSAALRRLREAIARVAPIPTPVPPAPERGPSSPRSAAPCSWTRSASCRWRLRPSSCACSRSERSPGSVAIAPSPSRPGWSRPPTGTWRPR